ncbi:MAG: alpha-ketoacid dehydrogenase subunit alpha/beta [Acidimicrobiia bacterium]
MPKQLLIDPADVRRPGRLEFRSIPVNAYRGTVAEARIEPGEDGLVRILRDMVLIRQFETALDRIKREGSYEDVSYWHRGPAHLCIGQESAAVGQAFSLTVRDHVFGSHRSHGEFIAKGMSAIAGLEEGRLQAIMEEHLGGGPFALVERHLPAEDLPTRAVQFLLYGLLTEIFGRSAGFNRGMGGSMHAFFPPFGIYPNNAIVGASAPIAAGAALFKKVMHGEGLVIANLGDASAGSGPVWEALNFSAMGQFRNLWEAEHRGGLPVIFFFVNNFYGMGGQPMGETMAYDRLSRIGGGVNPDALHAETVDGNNPLAVLDAIRRARVVIENGNGPVLLDCQTYRQSGHSPSDASSYRTREELDLWRAVDPISEYGGTLEAEGVVDEGVRRKLDEWARRHVLEALRLATDSTISPPVGRETVATLMFSHTEEDLETARPGMVEVPLPDTSRARQLSQRSRSGIVGGQALPSGKAVQLRDALFEAIAYHAAADDRLVIYGQENRDWGGAFGVYRGLTELLPYHRLFNAPISEAAIVGSAVGYAMEGGRALVELMYADFMGRAGDEIFNQLAKWQAMSGGMLKLPVVLRISVGNSYGAQHSQEWTALAAHIPGLKVVYPVTPYDAKGLMASALAGNDPVLFFESQRLYSQVEIFHPDGVPPGYYRIPIGVPKLVRSGGDLTILSVGATLYRAMEAADRLADEFEVQAEVIDARSLVPFDYWPVVGSVEKTGRLLCTSDASERGSYLATLATNLQLFAFHHLKAPIALVGAPNTIVPPAELEHDFFPSARRIVDAVHMHLRPLSGYQATDGGEVEELMGRAAGGL